MVIEFKELKGQQKEAIDGYTKSGYKPINIDLRENRYPLLGDPLLSEHTTRIIDHIFFSVPATKNNPPIVYRGTYNDITYNNLEFKVTQFMSTSTKESIARKKEFLLPNNGVLLKIHLQCSNITLLEIDEGSQFKECEYLIPRNTKFRVLYRGEEVNTETSQLIPFIGICPIQNK